MTNILNFQIKDPLELNLSYIPFINEGGIFIPTKNTYPLGETVEVHMQLPKKKKTLKFLGKVIWVTPPNALYLPVPGIGVQFAGPDAKTVRKEIEALLDTKVEVGGFTCGITDSKSSTPVA